MILLCEIIIFSLAFYSYKVENSIYNPSTVFLSFWGVLLSLASMRLFNLIEFGNEILIYITLGCVFFFFGSIFLRKNIKLKSYFEKEYDLNKINLSIGIVVCLMVLLYRMSFQLPYLLSGVSLSELRYSNIISYPPIQGIIFNFFALPFLDAATTVLIIDCIYNNKSFKSFIVPLGLVIVSFISNGARLSIFQFAVVIVFSLFYFKKLSKKNLKNILKYGLLFIFIILFIEFINTNRGSDSSILKSAYFYFTGSIVYADQFLNTSFFDVKLYGVNSIGGILRPIYSFLGIFGIQEPNLLMQAGEFMSQSCQNTIFSITANASSRFNYMATIFLYFFKDGGVFGIAIMSFLYGIFCKKYFLELKNKINIHTISIYAFILVGIFTSFAHFCFSYFIYTMTFFYILLLTTKLRRRKLRNGD